MNSNSRAESDRLKKRNWFIEILQRPEIGPFGVMLLLILALGFFSIPENANTWNLFEGEGLNALGIRNNLRIIAQLGIIALGAGLLIIAGEFDLSIGSMIGFAGMCMAITLKWGFHIVIPYISFTNGISVEKIVIASFNNVTPLAAVFITLCFTLFFGWLMGSKRFKGLNVVRKKNVAIKPKFEADITDPVFGNMVATDVNTFDLSEII